MDISQFLGGNYFSQTDLLQPAQVMTIEKVDQQLVGQPPNADQKICTHLSGCSKPLALNKTNLKRVAAIYGTDATRWIGQPVLVYRATTDYAGKITLCVRVCGPHQAPPEAVCDAAGNAVQYIPQPPAAPAPAPAAPAPVQQPAAPQPVAAPVQQPVAAPQPVAQPQQPQQPAPWEQPQQQNNPPSA